jgi:hypothetical protein
MFVVKQTSTGYLLQSGDSLDVVIFFNRNSTTIRPNLDFEGTFFLGGYSQGLILFSFIFIFSASRCGRLAPLWSQSPILALL